MSENKKIIERLRKDATLPSEWIDKIQDALFKTEAMKIKAVNYNPPDNDREDIECTCPKCRAVIPYESLDEDIYCEKCGQLLTDWDELIYVSNE